MAGTGWAHLINSPALALSSGSKSSRFCPLYVTVPQSTCQPRTMPADNSKRKCWDGSMQSRAVPQSTGSLT